jgi:hypothetical protein
MEEYDIDHFINLFLSINHYNYSKLYKKYEIKFNYIMNFLQLLLLFLINLPLNFLSFS